MPSEWKRTFSKDYQALGLDTDASQEELKKAYRELVKRWHPDRFQGGSCAERLAAEERFKEIAAAYQRITAALELEDAMQSSGGIDSRDPKTQSPRQEAQDPTENPAHPKRSSHASSKSDYSSKAGRRQKVENPFRKLRSQLFKRTDVRLAAMFVFLILFAVGLSYLSPPLYFTQSPPKPPLKPSSPTVITPLEPGSNTSARAEPEVERNSAPGRVGPGPENPPAAAEHSTASFFTLGSTQAEVLRVQGAPTRSHGQTWSYGLCDVYFKDGRVRRYNNFDGSLRVQLLPSRPLPPGALPFFSLGSSKDEVLSVQGTPTRVDENKWYFGFSELRFKEEQLVGYDNFFGDLKVRMLPATPLDLSNHKDHFTLGSTRDEVLAVQGTPTSVQGNMWFYQFSNIIFKDGRVQSVVNGAGNLRFVAPEETAKADGPAAEADRHKVGSK